MIAQRQMGNYKYKGRDVVLFESCFNKEERDGWIFVDNGDAYAAVKVVRGGYFWADPIRRKLFPHDDYSPIIYQLGRRANYGSFDAFKQAVLKAPYEYKDGKLTYHGPHADKLEFFPAESNTGMILPRINGKPLDLDLEYTYKSPYMQSKFGSDIVTVTYGDRTWEYDFEKNTVTEK
jgi:hypothetical protein